MKHIGQLLGCFLLALSSSGAISISNAPVLLTFDSQPAATEWRAESIGREGAHAIITPAELEVAVQALSPADIMNALPSTTALPPLQFNYACWNSNGKFIQSRVGNNYFGALLAVLRNDTGQHVVELEIAYDFANGTPGTGTEHIPGFRAFWSLLGQAGSWMAIPELSTGDTGRVSVNLELPHWPPGALLHLLWADDNGNGSDPHYIFDNLSLTARLEPHLTATRRGSNEMELSWSHNFPGWQLQWSDTAQPGTWHAVEEPLAVSGGRFRLTVSTTSNQRFYRVAVP